MKREEFGALVAGLERRGISKTEIARKTGSSYSTIWRLRHNEIGRPSFETVRRLELLSRDLDVTRK